jgi:hypothetical protein
MQEIPATDGHSANPRFRKKNCGISDYARRGRRDKKWKSGYIRPGNKYPKAPQSPPGQREVRSFMDYDLGYFDLETRVLEPLENPFGPKVLPMS